MIIRGKAICVRQPWAWLIVNGYKPIENRNWKCNHIGLLYIHAGKTFDKEGYNALRQGDLHIDNLPDLEEISFQMGGIVGQVNMVDCVTESPSPWFFGRYGFVFEKPELLPFTPMRGNLNLFNIEAIV